MLSEDMLIYMESLLPMFFASFAKSEQEKKSVLKLGELCKKHNIPFRTYMNVSAEYAEWEASQKNV